MCKLWKFSIIGNLWSWLRAYLTDRVQYISVGQSFSKSLPVISGVPQELTVGYRVKDFAESPAILHLLVTLMN